MSALTNAGLTSVYRQIPKSSCPPSCGECCGLVFPSLAEIRNIKDWCEEHHIEYKEFFTLKEINCPYLTEDKSCSIYPVRPFLCRLLGVSRDLPCPIGNCKPEKMLNHAQSNWVYKAIYMHGKEKPRIEKHRRLLGEIAEVLK